jgi:LysR family glycine cleavage system transcriptional activator
MSLTHAMTMSRLPPLSALRAFAAAARHRSFTKAAHELHLTQSAVSRHVRNLEVDLGCDLFVRGHRSIALTAEGQSYMRELVTAFARMDLATRRIRHAGRQDVLNIHAYTTFAMQWLIPRLKRFQNLNPEIDVRLTASVQPIDLYQSEVHGAIRTKQDEWDPEIRADRLFASWLIPIASTTVAGQLLHLEHPNDLQHHILLHALSRMGDWKRWLDHVGADRVDPMRGLRFESSSMAYLAAQRGLGVAIAQRFLVQEELRNGSLVQVLPQTVRSDRTYYFLTAPQHVGHSALETFRAWLLDELPDPSASDEAEDQ